MTPSAAPSAASSTAPPTLAATPLGREGIALLIPHRGRMCLLGALLEWSPDSITCRIDNAADADHPLRSAKGLLSPIAIEYAAQAMALHAALCQAPGSAVRPGFLASARGVQLRVPRLDDAAGPLTVSAQRLAGADTQALYQFALRDALRRLLVQGRATVVLNRPLSTPMSTPISTL